MAYKPILFNTEMVKAIQNGRKTQTRRIIKLDPGFSGHPVGESGNPNNPLGFMYPCGIKRPPCNKGDILWVREAWRPIEASSAGWCRIEYKAGGSEVFQKIIAVPKHLEPWHPSIHMPKQAARIFLRVEDVRAERLRQITQQGAVSEGISRLFDHMTKAEYEKWAIRSGVEGTQSEQPWKNYLWHGHFGDHGMGNKLSDAWPWQFSGYETPCGSFSSLWNSTVPLKEWDNYGWGANPWVWVIEFERCEKPERWC